MAPPFAARLARLRPQLRARWAPSPGSRGGARRDFACQQQQRAFASEKQGSVPFPSQEDLSRRVQIYLSGSLDPYLNLAAEHYLLQHTDPASTVLFLYRNRPCVVIGRNQNPWLEVDLRFVRRGIEPDFTRAPGAEAIIDPVDLVRRRSGGGTVFHDEGNLNWAVICPSAAFDRARHASMVARALGRACATHRTWSSHQRDSPPMRPCAPGPRHMAQSFYVNERNDIMMEGGYDGAVEEGLPVPPGKATTSESDPPAPRRSMPTASPESKTSGPAHQTASRGPTFKVSGSAYKLTRQRALHHGTCLLCSTHVRVVMNILSPPSPATSRGGVAYQEGDITSYVRAKGVESVRSKICNVGLWQWQQFQDEVVDEFRKMYRDDDDGDDVIPKKLILEDSGQAGEDIPAGLPDEVVGGYRELRSPEWIYGQTPQFVFSTQPTPEDPRPRDPGWKTAFEVPARFTASMTIRHGVIQHASLSGFHYGHPDDPPVDARDALVGPSLAGLRLWEIDDWADALGAAGANPERWGSVANWLNFVFGTRAVDHARYIGRMGESVRYVHTSLQQPLGR